MLRVVVVGGLHLISEKWFWLCGLCRDLRRLQPDGVPVSARHRLQLHSNACSRDSQIWNGVQLGSPPRHAQAPFG